MNYKKLYFELFNKITDFTKELQQIQAQMEYLVISNEEDSM